MAVGGGVAVGTCVGFRVGVSAGWGVAVGVGVGIEVAAGRGVDVGGKVGMGCNVAAGAGVAVGTCVGVVTGIACARVGEGCGGVVEILVAAGVAIAAESIGAGVAVECGTRVGSGVGVEQARSRMAVIKDIAIAGRISPLEGKDSATCQSPEPSVSRKGAWNEPMPGPLMRRDTVTGKSLVIISRGLS